MTYLVRKIARAKWPDSKVDVHKIQADAITVDLKTQKNTLSVWKIESEDKIKEAVLALLTAPKIEKIESMSVVIIPEQNASNAGLSLSKSDGETAVIELVETHRDITGLDYMSLGKVAEVVIESIFADKVKRFSPSDLKAFLKEANEAGKIDRSKLSEPLKQILDTLS